MAEVGNTAYTPNPRRFFTPWKEIWEPQKAKENLNSAGFEPKTPGLDLPMLYRLSYEASTGAAQGDLGSGSQ